MKTELVFIPLPATGHLVPMVQLAKQLVGRDENLSITILIFKLPFEKIANSYTQSLHADESTRGIKCRQIHDPPMQNDAISKPQRPFEFLSRLLERKKPQVRTIVSQLKDSSGSSRLAGFVVDMFCTSMIDVANEFEVPTYVFHPSSVSMIGFRHHILSLEDDNDCNINPYTNPDDGFEFSVSTYVNPVPAKLCPLAMFNENASITQHTRRLIFESKGIVVNSFLDLESHAIRALTSNPKMPSIYPVGPLINFSGIKNTQKDSDSDIILRWLDDQPLSSVIFFCFGSFGSFEVDQVKEIADAIERSRCRFLWSLRRPQPKESVEYPSEYENYEEVLPEGFLKRNSGSGMVIGWAPQARVLAHPAVGGFVTHCGWNSVVESVWFGVPMAAWPMYAEQQMNAFLLVKELGIAAEIKMDYKSGTQVLVRADEIECGIRKLMQPESEIRKKVKELMEKARNAMVEEGSSYNSLGRLIEDFDGSIKAAIDPK